MLVVAISDEETIAHLDRYRTEIARLADPRGVSADERARVIHEAKPIYWMTGSIHSPETGSPEMLMELAYRLAVDESEPIKAIRAGRDHAHDSRARDGRPRPGGRCICRVARAQGRRARGAAGLLGEIHGPRQQSRRHGTVAAPDAEPS